VEAADVHDTKPHGVQATFRNGKNFWYRDEDQAGRVDSLVIWAEKTRAATLKRYFGRRSSFKRAYPVSVKVLPFERTEALEHAFTNLAATGNPPSGREIPDIVVGPHDWIGRVAH
jgi:arabinogalactan oligomer/maltooligosaccharide transport system substrate-binding protein